MHDLLDVMWMEKGPEDARLLIRHNPNLETLFEHRLFDRPWEETPGQGKAEGHFVSLPSQEERTGVHRRLNFWGQGSKSTRHCRQSCVPWRARRRSVVSAVDER